MEQIRHPLSYDDVLYQTLSKDSNVELVEIPMSELVQGERYLYRMDAKPAAAPYPGFAGRRASPAESHMVTHHSWSPATNRSGEQISGIRGRDQYGSIVWTSWAAPKMAGEDKLTSLHYFKIHDLKKMRNNAWKRRSTLMKFYNKPANSKTRTLNKSRRAKSRKNRR